MAYVAPTAADVKARFPEFAAVDDTVVDAVLAEAGSFVDASWIESDRATAELFYTAHELVMAGQGTSAAAKVSQVGDFTRIKSGDLEVTRGGGSGESSSAATGTLGATRYGLKFLELRARSFPGIISI